MNLKEILENLKENQAILHYNVSTFEQIKAGILAVKETNIPLILGVSEGERNYLNPKLVKKIIDFYKDEENLQNLIFLNADHSKSLESAKKAIDLNYDSVLIDLSELELEENIRQTKELVKYADSRGPNAPRTRAELGTGRPEPNLFWLRTDKRGLNLSDDIRIDLFKYPHRSVLIEGEVGKIEGRSEIQKEIKVSEEDLTKIEDAIKYVSETGVDLLAVSIGNIHGITSGPIKLDFERGAKIYQNVKIPLVLHGGSGISMGDFKRCIEIGFKIIHINTEFRKIWKEKLSEELNKDTVTPYKILEPVVEALKEKIIYYQKSFWGLL
jgi:fructose-bisphosphate aldolase class II